MTTTAHEMTPHYIGRARTVHLGYKRADKVDGRAVTACGRIDARGPRAHQNLRTAYGQQITCKACIKATAPADEAAAAPKKRTYTATAPSGHQGTRTSLRTYTHAAWIYWPHEGDTADDAGIVSFHGTAQLAEKACRDYRNRGAVAGWVAVD